MSPLLHTGGTVSLLRNASSAGDSEAVYKVAALLGWKTPILRSVESAVETLWTQALLVAIIGKGRITFQSY